ncbi:MAG: putative thiamine biosynthesis protein [Gammaproteobacteria bacterium]|nr:putative thiamine biosynthesis protein [Gammaproteobacteria bacterium]
MIKLIIKIFIFCLLLCCANTVFAAKKPLIVVLDWFVNPDHAPLVIAEEKGFFKENGIAVKLINPADPSDAEKLVAAGKADIGVSYQPYVMAAIDQGLPLVRIGTLVNSPLNAITVLSKSSIQQIKDLRGKRIGYSSSDLDKLIFSTVLSNAGLTLTDVQWINVHYGLTQALLSGNIDAAVGMMRNVEPVELELSGHQVRVFYPEDYGVPAYDELVYIANKNKANDPRLSSFLRAVQSATAYLKKHPQLMWEAFAKAYPENNNAFNEKSWTETIPYFADEPEILDGNDTVFC